MQIGAEGKAKRSVGIRGGGNEALRWTASHEARFARRYNCYLNLVYGGRGGFIRGIPKPVTITGIRLWTMTMGRTTESTEGTAWSRKFDEPITLPNGRRLITLRDAGTYITKLPKKEHMAPEWQAAMRALILVVNSRTGPTMVARIGVMKALNRHVERVFDPSRKDPHWNRRPLKRDR